MGVVANQAIIAKTTWFYLGWVWLCTLFIDKMASSEAKIDHGVQIIHDRTNHWIVASNMKRTGGVWLVRLAP